MQQMMRWANALFVRKRDLIHMVLELLSTGLFNVGIGTGNPNATLHVSSRGATLSVFERIGTVLPGTLRLFRANNAVSSGYNGSGISSSDNLILAAGEGGSIALVAGGGTKVRVSSNGDMTVSGYLNAQRLIRSSGTGAMPANTAISIDIPSFPCAFLFYPQSGATPAAIFYCRANNVAPVQIASSNPNTDYHTGALTGTTGTASRINFSVHDGKLYVENRLNWGVNLDYLLVTR